MAVWQFKIHFVPREVIINEQGKLPNLISEDEIIQMNPWQGKYLDFGILDEILPESSSWSPEIRIWGDNYGDNISVMFEGDKVEWITIEIDIRGSYINFASNIISLAKKWDCLLFIQNENKGKCIKPELNDLINELHASLLYKYIHNPEDALRDLHRRRQEKGKDE
ncbi:MAG: hypothetical protein JW860_01175 [Sedimentisphaerales bacterium]|nr:hypothetical protein [Sedimentisphaerales bacterium]